MVIYVPLIESEQTCKFFNQQRVWSRGNDWAKSIRKGNLCDFSCNKGPCDFFLVCRDTAILGSLSSKEEDGQLASGCHVVRKLKPTGKAACVFSDRQFPTEPKLQMILAQAPDM